jgi:ABC-type transport system involved in multi-copper enzyme maturation permease subunit
VSTHAAPVPRAGIKLQVRLRATAHSEWIKFRSVRSAPATLLATALFVLVGAVLLATGYRNGWATMSPGEKASFDPVYTSLSGIELAQLLIGALGVMTVTGEYASGLIRGTFIATPQRAQVLAIKALIFTVAVWVVCTALSFGAFFIGQSLLTSPAKHATIGDPGVLTAVFGGGLYLTLVGLLSLFIGVLLRRTAAALIALFVLLLVLPVAAAMLPSKFSSNLAEFLPSNAGGQIWKLPQGGAYALSPWQGFGVLVAYVAVTALAAFVLIRRRDVS